MTQEQSLTFTEIVAQIFDQFRWHWRSWDEIKNMSLFSKLSYANFFMFIFFVAFAIYQVKYKAKRAEKTGPDKPWLPAPDFPEVEGLPDFSWKDEEPYKLRTFKPKYHLTMAIQKLDPSELLFMDKTYVDRIEYRKKIMKQYPDVAVLVNDDRRIRGAVRELYTWLMGTYLPKRYPKMFKLHYASFETGNMYMLENTVTKMILPAQPEKTSDTKTLLENLGKTIDEDFLFLLPEDTEEGKEGEAKYILEALVCICPSGWDPTQKIGLRLASIHTPVPGYSKLLEGSMDRYFNKVEVGDYIQRSNWNVTTNGELFSVGSASNHAYEGEKLDELKEIDVDNTFLRCERQTLHRLPKSEAMVFAFKTYMYNIKDIKAEGVGEDLAQAIDGMGIGNVPAMAFYKRSAVWGTAVKEYLRS